MKIGIITCYESNEERVKLVKETGLLNGYEIEVFTTDFSHIRKEKRNNIPQDFRPIKTKPYQSNLSFKRMASHFNFAIDVFKEVEKYHFDLIWLMAPANSLIYQAAKFKKKHPEKKLIIDIIDMWPESLPIKINKNIFPFSFWRNLRSKYIKCADTLVCECDYYKDILNKEYHKEIKTLRWAKDLKNTKKEKYLANDKLSLVYTGSINNIVDAQLIGEIIKNTNYPVEIHVIGEGENKDNFINILNKYCKVIYHGPLWNDEEKSKIYAKCEAGVNIYKEGLYIGLTVKCLDYLAHGLPIINNIKGDTFKFVEEEKIGINVNNDSKIDVSLIKDMAKNNQYIYDFYQKNFSKDVFNSCVNKILKETLE